MPRDAARGEHGAPPASRSRARATSSSSTCSKLLEAQAKARVSRIGQRFPTTAWHLVAQDSVDVPLRAAADKQAEVGGVDVRIGALVQKVLADAAPRERVAPAPLKQVRLKLRGW